jgi:hypothetical protein
MEETMLGEKKAIPLWRRRRPNFLALERALESAADPSAEQRTNSERVVIEERIARQRTEQAWARAGREG